MDNKHKKNLKDIDYYNHIEKLILKDDYLKHFNIDKIKEEEVEIILEEKRLKWLNEKIYKLKENLIYNNLSSDYLHELNLSNLSYYKTYFETFKNFDSEDYSNLVLLRMNFLDHIIEQSKEKEKALNAVKIANEISDNEKFSGDFLSKKSILKNETDQYSVDDEKQRVFNQIFSTISSLFSVILLYDIKASERSKTKEEIILCLFNNLNMQSEKVYFHSIYAMKEIEKNLFLLINIFQQNLLSGSIFDNAESKILIKNEANNSQSEFKSDDYLNFISDILEKLISVTARLNSFTSFLKILYILKENKIALKNYNYLIENILNPKVRSLIKPIDEKYFIEEKKIVLNDYFCNSEVLQTEILADEKFIFFQSLVLRDKSDLYINIFNIDKELKGNKLDQNKILDFKSYSIRDYLFETVRIKIAENIKKDLNENEAEYPDYLSNLKKIVNSEIRIKTILPHNNDHVYILFNQLNTESYKILKISKDNFSLVNETNIDSLNTYETVNIFTTRDCFYFLKRQINDENKFNSEKLDIFDSGSKEKNSVFEFERLDFSSNKKTKSDLKSSNIFSDFEKKTIIFDYSKLNFIDKEKKTNNYQKANHTIIKDFIEFCKEDVNNKFYSLYYLNNKLIFFKKSSIIKKFHKIDLSCFFNDTVLSKDPIKIYDSIAENICFTEMEMTKEKELANNFNLFYDINSNFVYGLSLVEKTANKEYNMELFKFDELVIKYRIYYNPYSFPAVDDSIHDILNNNRINETKKLLDSILELDEIPSRINKYGIDLNEHLKHVNFDLIKTISSDFMNIDCSKEIIRAKLESVIHNENKESKINLDVVNEDLESKRIIKDYNNYKNLTSLFIKNKEDDLERLYSNNTNSSGNKNLKFVKDNELASELYFEIAFRSLSKYIINNSNIITTLKNVKKINIEVYDNFFKISYPKFVYHFGKNMSAELFNIFWYKNFKKLNQILDQQISSHNPSMFSSEIDGELILLDMILLENLLNNFKHLKMGYFENYFDINNLKEFSSLLVKILTFKLNDNYEVKKISYEKNTTSKKENLENEILNQTTKILVSIMNNVKNHSFIFSIKNLDDFAKLLVNKLHKQKIDFCDKNSYLFYFLSLFLNTSEITLNNKYEIIDFILKSEILFVKNLNKCFNENLNVDLHIKNKYFEKTFNNVIYFLIKDFTGEENLKNLNNKDSKQIKILNILNENLIDLINEMKKINKNLLEHTRFKLYIKNFSLILNSNFIIFNLIFRLYNYEYTNLISFKNIKNQKTNQKTEITINKENLLTHKFLSNKEYYKLLKDERKEIPYLIIEKTLLLLFYLNELDTILLDVKGKTGVIYDLISDKIYTCDSEHPQNIKNKNFYSFEFSDKNNKYIKFDYCSKIFNKSKIELNAKYDIEFENKLIKEKFESPKPKGIPYTQSYANLTAYRDLDILGYSYINNTDNLANETSILIENNENEAHELENFRIDNNLHPENAEVKQIIESKSKIDLETNSGYLNSDYIKIKDSKNLKTLNFKYELDAKFEDFINSDPARINLVEETYKFYGYKFKLFNFEDPNMIDDYLIKNLKRLLIFLICKIFDLILISPEIYDYVDNENEKVNNINFNLNTNASKNPGTNYKLEEKFYQEIFTSRLLNNASLINNQFMSEEIKDDKKDDLETDKLDESNKTFIFSNLDKIFYLLNNLQVNLSKKGDDLLKILNTDNSGDLDNRENLINIDFFCDLYESKRRFNKEMEQERSNSVKNKEVEIIKDIIDNVKEAYEIAGKVIHKSFIMKNPWGRIGGKLVDKVINYIFVTVMKYNNLILKYGKLIEKIESILTDENNKKLITVNEDCEKQIQQNLHNQITNIDNYSLFLKIYTECSKIRSWLNEKKIYYTDIETKKENIPAQKRSSEKIIDVITRKSNETKIKNDNEDNIIKEFFEEHKFEVYANTLINHKLCFLLEIHPDSTSSMIFKEENLEHNKLNNLNNLDAVQFNKDILEVIESVFTFIKSENIKTENLIKKINYQNAKALNKEAFLILFNFMISILNNQNEIQDLLYWINSKFKESEFIIDFNKDLYGSDPKLNKRVYNQFYNFIFLLIRKLKKSENENNSNNIITKSNITSVGLINIFQSLIWKIRKSDFEFYKTHGFFDIFSSKGIISNILNLTIDSNKAIPNLKDFESKLNNLNNENIETYGKDCFDVKFLQNFIFDSFSIFSLQILNKFHSRHYNNEEEAIIKSFKDIDEEKLNENDMSVLLQKKTSVLHSDEFVVIDIISNILFNELNKYIENWRLFIKNKMQFKHKGLHENMIPFANEDKLNSYLILLFRCLSFNSHLIDHFTISHPNLFPIILEIFLYANEKNKILIIKFIELFIRFYNENLLNKCMVNFIENSKYIFSDLILVSLQNTYLNKGDNLNMRFLQENKFNFKNFNQEFPNGENHIGFKLLFEFILTLTKAMLNSSISLSKKIKYFKTNADKEIGFEFIYLIRNFLKNNNNDSSKLLEEFILEKIRRNLTNDKKINSEEQAKINGTTSLTNGEYENLRASGSDDSDKILLLLILGVDFCPLRVGQKVAFEQVFREKDNYAYDIYEYSFVSAKNSSKNFEQAENDQKSQKKDELSSVSLDSESDRLRLGVIVGFTNSSNNPFVIDASMNEFSYENLSYSPDKRYAVIVVENSLNMQNMKILNFETVVIDIEKLIIKKENPVDNFKLLAIIKESGLSNWILNYLSEEIRNEKNEKFRYICLNLFTNLIMAKEENINNNSEDELGKENLNKDSNPSLKFSNLSIVDLKNNFFVNLLKDLNENDFKSIIMNLEEFSLFSLRNKIRSCTLEKLENDNIYDLISETEEDLEEINLAQNDSDKKSISRRKNSVNDRFSFLGSFNKNTNSFCVKFCGNFIKEFEVDFVYNFHKVVANDEKNIFHYLISIQDFISLDLTKDEKSRYFILSNSQDLNEILLSNEKNKKNKNLNYVKFIVTDNSLMDNKDFNKGFDESPEIFGQVPILILNQLDFMKVSSFIFEGAMDEEFSYLIGCPMDFSSFLEIPSYLVDESVQYGQRDLILKILNEAQPKEKQVKLEKNVYKDDVNKKLTSLLSRRIMLILLAYTPKAKTCVNVSNLIKIFKLTLLENNIGKILSNRNWFYPKNDSEEGLLKSAIEYNLRLSPTYLIKNFLYNLTNDYEVDKKITEQLLQLDIFEKNNFIEEYLIANIKTEEELLKFEIFENDVKIIFAILDNEKLNWFENNENSNIFKDYHMKFIHVLALNNQEITLKNARIGEFSIDAINIIFNQINDLLESVKNSVSDDSEESISNNINCKNKKALESILKSLENYKFIFSSPEFKKLFEKVFECVKIKNAEVENTREIQNIDLKIINLLISVYDMVFILFLRYNIDLNVDNFLKNKFLEIYFSYSLLNWKLEKFEILVLFKLKNELIVKDECKEDFKKEIDKYSNKIEFSHYFKEKDSATAHLLKYEFSDSEDVNLKVSYIDQTIMHPEHILMIYSKFKSEINNKISSKLEFQEFINNYDSKKNILIKNKLKNNFYISLPHGNYKTNLFNFGHNDKNSLGCGYNDFNIHDTPAPAIGINSKLIRSFKYGYYHSFAVTTDNKLYVCGKESGSGTKDLSPNTPINNYSLENYYDEIAQKHQVDNIWANNYNTTIMLTKDNQLYGSGKNTDGILCNLCEISELNDVEKPGRLPDIPNDEKIKLLACGYKSVMYLTESNNLYSIGCNSFYECGNRSSNERITQYFKLSIPSNIKITQVNAGENYFLFLGKDEYNKTRLYSIGCNNQGQSGMDGDNSGKFNLCKGVENTEFKVIASRNSSSAAISRKGELYTFGVNDKGNLAQPNQRAVTTPTVVKFFENFIVDEVSLSHFHMLVVCREKETGIKKIFSCGSNEYGCLGLPRAEGSLILQSPTEISYFTTRDNSDAMLNVFPVKVATSRYQSFVMGLMTNFEQDRIKFDKKCKVCCNELAECGVFFQNFPRFNKLEQNLKAEKDQNNTNLNEIVIEIKDDEKDENKKSSKDLIEIKTDKNDSSNNIDFICESCCNKINNIQTEKTIELNKNLIKDSTKENADQEKLEEKNTKENENLVYLNSLNSEISDLMYYITTPFKKDIQDKDLSNLLKSRTEIETEIVENFYKENKNNDIMDVVFVNFDKDKEDTDPKRHDYEKKLSDDYILDCLNCKTKLNENNNEIFISTEDPNLILCRFCSLDNPNCIKYPQVFYCFNKYRLHKNFIKYLPIINFSEKLYGVVKSSKPYLTLKIESKVSELNRLNIYKKLEAKENLFASAKKLNEDIILEFNELIDKKEVKNTNGFTTTSDLFNYITSQEYAAEGEFTKISKLSKSDFKILDKLSFSLNQSIVLLSGIISNSNQNNFIQKVITKNLNLIQPSKRLEILWEKMDRLRVSVNPNDYPITLNRMKAVKFYEKGIADLNGENTLFKQLFCKMKKFPVKNYLCKKSERLFRVYFKGEGASDMGGPYRDLFSNISEELQSDYLDLFIKTPNNKNDIGNLRDKFIPNPSSKSTIHQESYYFLGCLIASAIASGQLLSLNLHPLVWKMMLNRKVNFNEFDSIDKHFCKIMSDLEKCDVDKPLSQEEFEDSFDLNFTILLSDKTEVELIPNGKKTKVTLENKNKYIVLAKAERLREFKSQIESMRYGLM